MSRINLLPPRYHWFRALERRILWELAGLALVVLVLGLAVIGVRAKATAIELLTAALQPAAREYRTVNARFGQLQNAEKLLLERKAKAAPLLDRRSSILPVVRDFTRALPSGTRIVSLTVERGGKVLVQGESASYTDVARFVKWIGGTLRYDQVTLKGVQRTGGQSVQFTLEAVHPAGGATE